MTVSTLFKLLNLYLKCGHDQLVTLVQRYDSTISGNTEVARYEGFFNFLGLWRSLPSFRADELISELISLVSKSTLTEFNLFFQTVIGSFITELQFLD